MQGPPHRSAHQYRQHPRGHPHAPQPAQPAKPTKAYNPRHPERTLLYRTVAEHFETWLELASAGQFDGQGDHHTPAPYVEKAFRKYLECGIFAHDFVRVRCDDCGDDYLVVVACKGRAICASCNTRRMAEAAAHLHDHVFPHLPVRQWVSSVPKRIRYYLHQGKGALNSALRISFRVVQQSLVAACPSAAKADPASLHLSAVAFIHRFGSSLSTHVHFHVCVVDGVFEAFAGFSVTRLRVRYEIRQPTVDHVSPGIDRRCCDYSDADRSTSQRAQAPATLLRAPALCHGSAQATRC